MIVGRTFFSLFARVLVRSFISTLIREMGLYICFSLSFVYYGVTEVRLCLLKDDNLAALMYSRYLSFIRNQNIL